MAPLLSSALAVTDEEIVQVEEEPALEIALPQVFTRPELTVLRRDRVPHVEWLVARLYRASVEERSWGPDYQALANEFQPLFAWGIACWDYLLSTEGCRFLLRGQDEKRCRRGDYRVVTDRDYGRLLHRVFRQCLLDFAQTSLLESFSSYLRAHFWDRVVAAYRRLEDPPDPRQRKLSGYSYLRCAPYQFLNGFHQDLVDRALPRLPTAQAQAATWYFLNFFTVDATAQAMGQPAEAAEDFLRRGLLSLLIEHRLVYCLLRQIERY